MSWSIIPESVQWLLTHPTFSRHPLRTLLRWVYWQVRQRLTDRPLQMSFVNESALIIHPREGLTGYWYVRLPDYDEQKFLLNYLQEGDVFFDVGANAGAYSVLAASLGCKVYAFEPVPKTFERLSANIHLNEAMRIEAMQTAVGEFPGRLSITTDLGPGNHLVLESDPNHNSIAVDVLTLSDLVTQVGAPSFIKIDVEGFELEVIRGAGDLLDSKILNGFLIETFRPQNWHLPKLRELEAILERHGFLPYEYDAAIHQLRALQRIDEGANNTFYFRDLDTVQSRLMRKI